MKFFLILIRSISICIVTLGLLNTCISFAGEVRAVQLARLSIEDLVNMKITSVLKTPQSLSKSPAAVFVLTQEDIRRSGVSSIPDLLRLVPGVQVAELDEKIFAVSIRGFNDIHANKLLVMLDGRSIYNHIFSGVIWSNLDIFMEDIERIEIIRGPGSSVWGANAVNGVINIISKKSWNTKGTLIHMGTGKPDIISGGIRYGGEIGNTGAFRIFAKAYDNSNDHLSQPGFEAETRNNSGMGGFRTDWNINKSDNLTLQGEFTANNSKNIENNPNKPGGERSIDDHLWDFLCRWNHTFNKQSKTIFQVYYQNEERKGGYKFSTIDLDFQHEYQWPSSNHLVWGFGYRFIDDEIYQGLLGGYIFDPIERSQHLYSFFIQDTIKVIPDYLDLTLGTKFEHNDYTGYEIQPGVRISFTPLKKHNFWGAFSRAVRTPSRLDSDSKSTQYFPELQKQEQNTSGFTQITGDKNFDSEDLAAYEIGYRTKLFDEVWLDTALFYNVYDNLFTYREKEKNIWVISNDMEGETHGIEISLDYRPARWWKLSGSWSFLNMNMKLKNEQAADITNYIETICPEQQFFLHSAMDIGKQVRFDLWVRHVDNIRHMKPPSVMEPFYKKLDDYTMIDARLAWKPEKNIELSITGRNLGKAHQEFTNYEVEQSVFCKIAFDFGE